VNLAWLILAAAAAWLVLAAVLLVDGLRSGRRILADPHPWDLETEALAAACGGCPEPVLCDLKGCERVVRLDERRARAGGAA
jgi:hypothetical protein